MKLRSFVSAIVLVGFFSQPLWAAVPMKGYRVIHASPDEFASALSTRLARYPMTRQQHYASRLDRFFRIQSKLIEGNTVTMNIMPDLPLVDPAFGGARLVTVKTTLVDRNATSFFYDVELTAGFTVLAKLEVSPHPSGSLMTCQIVKSPALLPESLIFKTLFALGFMAQEPAGAENL